MEAKWWALGAQSRGAWSLSSLRVLSVDAFSPFARSRFLLLALVVVFATSFVPSSSAATPFEDSVVIPGEQSTEQVGETRVAPSEAAGEVEHRTVFPPRRAPPAYFTDPILGIAKIGIIHPLAKRSPLQGTAKIRDIKSRVVGRNPAKLNAKTKAKAKAKTTVSASSSRKQWVIRIPGFIRKILSWLGVKLPQGSIITIVIGGGSGTTTPPTKPPSTTAKPPTNPPTKPPSTGPLPGTISALRDYMKKHFGINPADGSRAAWSKRQLEEANKVLATLPASFVRNTTSIQRDSVFQSKSVLGYVRMGIPTVHLLNSSCRQGTFQGTLVHEMTHCFQAKHPQIAQLWEKSFWPYGRFLGAHPGSVSSYGNSSPLEDMAESVRTFWQAGKQMKAQQPKRYEFIKKYVMNGREF